MELASLKEGFRKANPGQMEESTSGKMMSRLTGVFQKKRDLNEAELAQMKGADFHTLLYERLRAQEAVADETLRALAKTRGEAALAVLKSADAPADRASLLEPEKADADGAEVKLKMDLKPVARQAGAVTPAAVPATQ